MTMTTAPAATATEGGWTDEYREIVAFYFWSPQHLNRYATRSSVPWETVWGKLRRREVPLNHLLSIFFRLAPSSLTEDILHLALSDFPLSKPSLFLLRDHPISGICQPDFAFTSGEHLVFMEMKVEAKLTVEQVVKYALAAAVLKPAGRKGLVCLGSDKVLKGADEFTARLARGEDLVSPKLHRYRQKLGVSEADLNEAMARLELGRLSYGDLHRALLADMAAAPAQDETRRKLIAGMVMALEELGLVSTAGRLGRQGGTTI